MLTSSRNTPTPRTMSAGTCGCLGSAITRVTAQVFEAQTPLALQQQFSSPGMVQRTALWTRSCSFLLDSSQTPGITYRPRHLHSAAPLINVSTGPGTQLCLWNSNSELYFYGNDSKRAKQAYNRSCFTTQQHITGDISFHLPPAKI